MKTKHRRLPALFAAATLLDDGADVNAANPDGMTALMAAVIWDKELIVNLLLERGARKGIKDKKGRTAISIGYGPRGESRPYGGLQVKPVIAISHKRVGDNVSTVLCTKSASTAKIAGSRLRVARMQ